MKKRQVTPLELAIHDKRPVHEWAVAIRKLVPRVYETDARMARKLELAIERIVSSAANLDCIATDDPTAPEVGAPTDRVTEYLFRRWPEEAHDLGKALTRADQVLGREEFLNVIGPSSNSAAAADAARPNSRERGTISPRPRR